MIPTINPEARIRTDEDGGAWKVSEEGRDAFVTWHHPHEPRVSSLLVPREIRAWLAREIGRGMG